MIFCFFQTVVWNFVMNAAKMILLRVLHVTYFHTSLATSVCVSVLAYPIHTHNVIECNRWARAL